MYEVTQEIANLILVLQQSNEAMLDGGGGGADEKCKVCRRRASYFREKKDMFVREMFGSQADIM
jgi:hypothetical protein